jgi:hypothetical protein
MSRETLVQSVHDRWLEELAAASTVAIICSPYVTPKIALRIPRAVPPSQCSLYTRFSLEEFAAGSSSLRTLKLLLQDGYSLFRVNDLHAKIVLIPGQFASVGSQNLTARGLRNLEATYCTADRSEVAELERRLTPQLASAVPITGEMVEDALQVLPRLRSLFRAARRAATAAESELILLAERRLQLQRRAALRSEARKRVAEAIERLSADRELAQAYIRKSIWWHSHSSGLPVRAPRHALRVTGWEGDWRLELGANFFLVGRAIARCMSVLEEYLVALENEDPPPASEIVGRLRLQVRGAVANATGSEYNGFYPLTGVDMMFGTTSIDVADFVAHALQLLPTELALPLHFANGKLNAS